MSEIKKTKKHLTLENRIEIQECLGKHMSFRAIAQQIEKDPTTISKEVKNRSKDHRNGFTKTDKICPKLLKSPFVCNGCDRRRRASCIYARRIYVATIAHQEYQTTLREAREGIPLNKEEFYKTEHTISSAVRAGQHVYHAILANQLAVSKSSVYRHINMGYYSISRIDLPRAVKFKPRRKRTDYHVPKSTRSGRSFEDYSDFVQDNPDLPVVEMDTVIGRPGGKVIMTFHFIQSDFMFGILLDNKTAAEAGAKIALLKQRLSQHGFPMGSFAPILLTDNGGEFAYVSAFENNLEGEKELSVFYCDPNAPYQKPHIENNHTLFRNIVPSGTSFDTFTQDTVNLIFSHVNAVMRKQFNGKSAYDLFVYTHSKELASTLGVSFVDSKSVVQSPLLLKKSFPK